MCDHRVPHNARPLGAKKGPERAAMRYRLGRRWAHNAPHRRLRMTRRWCARPTAGNLRPSTTAPGSSLWATSRAPSADRRACVTAPATGPGLCLTAGDRGQLWRSGQVNVGVRALRSYVPLCVTEIPSSERPPRPGSSVDSNKPGQNRSVLSDTSTGRRRRRRRRASRLLGEPTHAMCLLSRTLHVVDAGQLRVLLVDMTTSSTGVVMATYRRAGDIQHGSSPSPGRPTRRWSAASLSPRTAPDSSDGGAELLVVCARRP